MTVGRFLGKKVGVFYGGDGSEREVSLRTGAAAAAALRRKGYDVREFDICGDWLGTLAGCGVDVAYIALHGRFGEDGCIQGALELARIPYTGSGVAACAVSMSKSMAKRVVSAAGVACAADIVLEGASTESPLPPPFGFPAVVKPDREGSSVGITIVKSLDGYGGAVTEARKHDSRILVEAFIPGREISVGIVDGRVLPAVEIVPKSGFYDYHSKYSVGETEYLIPVPMDLAILSRAADSTRKAAVALRLRGAARVDYRVDLSGNVVFLEANTIPGMTETSLLPKAARFDGTSFDDLVEGILETAGLDG